MYTVESNGVIQKFDSEVEALCVLATLKAFNHKAIMYKAKTIKIVYNLL